MKHARFVWLVYLAAGCQAERPAGPSIDAAGVSRVEIRRHDEIKPDEPAVASSDPEAVRAFVRAVAAGRETDDHKCATAVVAVITLRSSPPVELGLLPGHDARYYEYRRNGRAYRTPRPAMVDALKRLGMDNVPLKD